MREHDIVVDLVSELAKVEGVEPTELPYTLTDHVEPSILEMVVTTGAPDDRVTFHVAGHRVTVLGTGEFTIDGVGPRPETSRGITHLLEEPMPPDPRPELGLDARYLEGPGTMPDLCFVLDEDGIYRDILAKPERDELLYSAPDDLLGSSIDEMLPDQAARTIAGTIERTLDAGRELPCSYELPLQMGAREFAGRAQPFEHGGSESCVLLTVADVTDVRTRASRLSN